MTGAEVTAMKPAEVLVRHMATLSPSDPFSSRHACVVCAVPWPCDAVDQASQLQEAQAALVRSDQSYLHLVTQHREMQLTLQEAQERVRKGDQAIRALVEIAQRGLMPPVDLDDVLDHHGLFNSIFDHDDEASTLAQHLVIP